MNNQITNFRVTKKLSPAQPDAIKLARRYGEQLVCVRHRIDPAGTTRVTTIELVVEQAPLNVKADQLVGIRVGFTMRGNFDLLSRLPAQHGIKIPRSGACP